MTSRALLDDSGGDRKTFSVFKSLSRHSGMHLLLIYAIHSSEFLQKMWVLRRDNQYKLPVFLPQRKSVNPHNKVYYIRKTARAWVATLQNWVAVCAA